jgi:hypothetical protein
MKKYYIIVLVLISSLGFAQSGNNDAVPANYLPNSTPATPESNNLGSYGNAPVGLFTGSPNIQIPLLTYKTKNLNIPLYLSYSSHGIKVDDVNSKVGLAWLFNGIGIITRTVRDKPDEESRISVPDVGINGYNNLSFLDYFQEIGENPNIDSEADLFSFNLGNTSGQFVFDKNGDPLTMPRNDIKIEIYDSPAFPGIYSFKLTTNEGIKYYFDEKEQTMLRTSGEGHPEPSIHYTSWLLTKIVHPNGDEIYLSYETINEYYVASQSQQLSESYPNYQYQYGESYTKAPTFSVIYSHHTREIGKRIKTISSNNSINGKINFNYEDKLPTSSSEPDNVIKEIQLINSNLLILEQLNFNYLTTINKRIFLEQITYKDASKNYSFEYIEPNNFPLRLSMSQDHWGYYNGQPNTHLIPYVEGLCCSPKNVQFFALN